MTDRIDLPPRKPLSRVVTVVCDLLPAFGRIREHQFTTTLGAGATFRAAENTRWAGFYLEVDGSSPVWTSRELRELAEECVLMADYLDGRNPPQGD